MCSGLTLALDSATVVHHHRACGAVYHCQLVSSLAPSPCSITLHHHPASSPCITTLHHLAQIDHHRACADGQFDIADASNERIRENITEQVA